MTESVYITKVSSFLPNAPVSNNEIINYLGVVDENSARVGKIVLRQNGIKNRYYALTRDRKITHTNAELCREAIMALVRMGMDLDRLQLLAAGTSSPDIYLPGHAAMIHGILPAPPMEVHSVQGICNSGMGALKHAYLHVLTGIHDSAVSIGSETASRYFLNNHYIEEINALRTVGKKPILAFRKEFLRWMLSDGAGAVHLENKIAKGEKALKIEWVEHRSFANELPTCMYFGTSPLVGDNDEQGFDYWWSRTPKECGEHGYLTLQQDVRVLEKNILDYGCRFLDFCLRKHKTTLKELSYSAIHLSSMHFGKQLKKAGAVYGLNYDDTTWFTNLDEVGNIGAASSYLLLKDVLYKLPIEAGQKIMLFVPESGRFSYTVVLLTLVEG